MDNWSEIKYINFTYSSPNEDIELCTGLNPDGNVNVKYTLTSMRDKLLENVQILNQLLEKSNHITGLFAMGYNSVAVCVSSREEMDDMIVNNLIRDAKLDSEEESEEDDISDESDHETHSDRLRMMKNLIFSSESKHMSDSDEESTDNDDFIDAINMNELIHKYDDLIGQESDTD
jgi:hypothetical protein